MVNKTTINYAMKQLFLIGKEDGFRPYVNTSTNRIYIEFKSGKNLTLADSEIEYQAIEFLQSEIECCKHG